MSSTKKLTLCAMLTALSIALVMTIHIMIVNPLEYDPGDIPILIGGFVLGPYIGLGICLVTCLIQGLTVSAASGFWGIFMHSVATGAFVLISAFIYNKKQTNSSAIFGIVLGGLVSTALMIILNIFIMPIWYGMPTQGVIDMILPVILPFNLIKVGINGTFSFLIFKSLKTFISPKFA